MKNTLLTCILLCLVTALHAQTAAPKGPGSIKGIVIDSAKNAPLGFATIAVIDAETKQPVKSTLTKDNGSFELSSLPLKPYLLNVISVGYSTKTVAVNNLKADQPSTDLGKIILAPSSSQLNEVKVTAPKPLVKQEIDRLSYDVQADPDSKAQTAMDMLRKVPLISVDGDDNIQLQGSGSYKIFINGKPSQMLANNPKDILKAMPASNILKIEVITTPPAKYDAEGLAGIINIITNKTADDGYNGNVTARYNSPWGPNLNLTGTLKQGKFGVSGYVGGGFRPWVTYQSANERQTFAPVTDFSQSGSNKTKGKYGYSSVELSYEIDTLNLLTASAEYDKGRFDQTLDRFTQFTSEDPTSLPQSYRLLNNGGYGWDETDLGLNYQLGFKRSKQQLLTASYQYTYYSNDNNSDISSVDRVNYNNPDNNQLNKAGTRQHTLQLDYVHPLKQLTIEAGAKAIFRNNFSQSNVENLTSVNGQDIFVEDPTLSNDFNYHQNVYSLYNSYTYKAGAWTFKGGARMEHTHVDANFITNGSNLNMDYTNVIPSISVMRTLKNNQSLTFGFTNRLERPGIWQLNPFIDRSNPQIINTGNPNLRPVLSHLTELTYTRSGIGNISAKLSYMYTNNSIINVTRLIADTLTETTYDNVGQNKIARLNLNGSYPFTKKLNANINTGLFYVWIKGTYNGQFYSNKGPRTNTYVNVTYKPGDDWTIGAGYGYNRRYILLQGSNNDYMYSSITLSKVVFNKKLTITGVVNNPTQKLFTFKQYTSTPDFYQSNTNYQIYRTFSFSLNYKFGKLSSEIKKNQRSINNDDVSKQ
ncbi:TonB-dependent receptor domain-containing protein [Mucilaginibacter polytrichastri]|uniref:Outer membrane protein beta-barrel domain-containing protein n=1 Tax=Mucilaginibacter polytrichastri TaxID=1302689 RepID=A0A1Q6A117_9SPHI|nr:TonB-dependent receptor [Mucilaginibacter polytrichastri]OKS87710.1 hypothetical protein RG47T_3172 [Mucilaginibacter polytrichastri]SFT20041.1 Outer membrane receptor proteins, mostly Fe transport [Mucilaginibacter polytrichastri]